MTIGEDLGLSLGKVLSRAAYLGSAFREARVFHPEGQILRGDAKVDCTNEGLRDFARSLVGPTLIRFSAAVWKDNESDFDLLGCALRFGWDPKNPLDDTSVQDLLLATFKSLAKLPFATLTTRTHHYLDNCFYSATPYQLLDLRGAEFRVTCESPLIKPMRSRAANLAKAIESNAACVLLEIKHKSLKDEWTRILNIQLIEQVNLSQEKLYFSPFNSVKGIQPIGFINFIRKHTYASSSAGRAHTKHLS